MKFKEKMINVREGSMFENFRKERDYVEGNQGRIWRGGEQAWMNWVQSED